MGGKTIDSLSVMLHFVDMNQAAKEIKRLSDKCRQLEDIDGQPIGRITRVDLYGTQDHQMVRLRYTTKEGEEHEKRFDIADFYSL
ncbi:MAG: hypothetical protein V1729_00605 [Candidatus Woesearchaeota archaeon]